MNEEYFMRDIEWKDLEDEEIYQLLFKALNQKGLDQDGSTFFINETFKVLKEGGAFTVHIVNGIMAKKGFCIDVIDESVLELILEVMRRESDYSYKIHNHN